MEWEVKGKGVKKGEGRGRSGGKGGKKENEGEGAPIEMMPPNQNPKYATGATAIYLSSPVLIPNHNIRH